MTVPATHMTSRVILATPRSVFRTMIDPETIPTWRAPTGMNARIDYFDARPTGGYRMTLFRQVTDSESGKSQVDTDIIEGQFVELVPDERIVEAVCFETNKAGYQGTMILTTTLERVRDGTKVTLIAENVPPGISEADHRDGMASTLRNLANFVE